MPRLLFGTGRALLLGILGGFFISDTNKELLLISGTSKDYLRVSGE